MNRKSVVALAVRPHFGIFVSVCRGERERGREREGKIKKERECVFVVECTVLKTDCDERLRVTIISTV